MVSSGREGVVNIHSKLPELVSDARAVEPLRGFLTKDLGNLRLGVREIRDGVGTAQKDLEDVIHHAANFRRRQPAHVIVLSAHQLLSLPELAMLRDAAVRSAIRFARVSLQGLACDGRCGRRRELVQKSDKVFARRYLFRIKVFAARLHHLDGREHLRWSAGLFSRFYKCCGVLDFRDGVINSV